MFIHTSTYLAGFVSDVFKPQNVPKSTAAGSLSQTPLGELIALPRSPSWIHDKPQESQGKGETE